MVEGSCEAVSVERALGDRRQVLLRPDVLAERDRLWLEAALARTRDVPELVGQPVAEDGTDDDE